MSEQAPFRIAIREEGPWVNAYLAPIDSMDRTIHLGSISVAVCEIDPGVFDAFQALIQQATSAVTKAALGFEPARFETSAAPEHERAGNA